MKHENRLKMNLKTVLSVIFTAALVVLFVSVSNVRAAYDQHDTDAIRNFLEQTDPDTGKSNWDMLLDSDIGVSKVRIDDPGTWNCYMMDIQWDWNERITSVRFTANITDGTGWYGDLDLSGLTSLTSLSIDSDHLNSLNLSGCTALEILDFSGSSLTSVELNDCYTLKKISLMRTPVHEIDLSKCAKLKDIIFVSTSLTSINLDGMDLLETFTVYNNNSLASIQIVNTGNLTEITCAGNEVLTSLNLSEIPALTSASLYDNPALLSVDFSNSPSLENLTVYDNKSLASLDVSNCPALIYLFCLRNALTNLNASNCRSLESIECSLNMLTDLNIKDCDSLTSLRAAGNPLSADAITDLQKRQNPIPNLSYTENNVSTFSYYSFTIKVTIQGTGFVDIYFPLDPDKAENSEEIIIYREPGNYPLSFIDCIGIDVPKNIYLGSYYTANITSGDKNISFTVDFPTSPAILLPGTVNPGESIKATISDTFPGDPELATYQWTVNDVPVPEVTSDIFTVPVTAPDGARIDVYVTSGTVVSSAVSYVANALPAAEFVYHLYSVLFNRYPDEEGLSFWVNGLLDESITIEEMTSFFFQSPEIVNMNTANEWYVDKLYLVLMGRNPDDEGSAYWIDCLYSGMSRSDVLRHFLETPEFDVLCQEYGFKAVH